VNHTTQVILAVLVAAALVAGMFATGIQPAQAGGRHKYKGSGDSVAFEQENKQKAKCLALVISRADACNQEARNNFNVNVPGEGPPTPGEVGCPSDTVFDVTLEAQLPVTGTAVLQEGDELCLQMQGENMNIPVVRGGEIVAGLTPDVTVTPVGPDNACNAQTQQVRAFLSSGQFPENGNLGPTFVCVNLTP
jgi:hypothetical protein